VPGRSRLTPDALFGGGIAILAAALTFGVLIGQALGWRPSSRLLYVALILIGLIAVIGILLLLSGVQGRRRSRSQTVSPLLAVAEQILQTANDSLLENERILAPLIRDPWRRYEVAEAFSRLFHEQRDRGSFGQWEAFLEQAVRDRTNRKFQAPLEALLAQVRQLQLTFYAYYDSVDSRGEEQTKKHFVELVLSNRDSRPEVTDEEVIAIAEEYLESLRKLVENIGRTTGQIRAAAS